MILPVIPTTLTVVVSRGQSRNPEKRGLEAKIVEAAGQLPGVVVLDVPHLYDLKAGSEVMQTLLAVEGDMVVASWLFPRATHWLLDRLNVRGQVGETVFDTEAAAASADDSADGNDSDDSDPAEPRVTDLYPRQGRSIYSLDLRAGDADRMTAEIARIAALSEQANEQAANEAASADGSQPSANENRLRFDDPATRRWYPVIDYSRCTNCMECIDFCLFGVYGIDGVETILVEQPDNCRKGCPACSRVCPAGAIIFPQHKAPAIAGAPVEGDEGFKIDLSLLFGAPDKTADPVAMAARERDEQLLLAGRAAVGMPELRSRSESKSAPPDHLDDLIDQLDQAGI